MSLIVPRLNNPSTSEKRSPWEFLVALRALSIMRHDALAATDEMTECGPLSSDQYHNLVINDYYTNNHTSLFTEIGSTTYICNKIKNSTTNSTYLADYAAV